jgi:starvation-inducible DNA-binding protein
MDELAERSRMLGGHPIATAKECLDVSEIDEAYEFLYTPQKMVEILAEDNLLVIDALHIDIQRANTDGDIGSADLLTKMLQMYQKHHWYLAETAARKYLV